MLLPHTHRMHTLPRIPLWGIIIIYPYGVYVNCKNNRKAPQLNVGLISIIQAIFLLFRVLACNCCLCCCKLDRCFFLIPPSNVALFLRPSIDAMISLSPNIFNTHLNLYSQALLLFHSFY